LSRRAFARRLRRVKLELVDIDVIADVFRSRSAQ
jgi:hypothetical protein